MDSHSIWMIFLLVILLFFSALFSAAETAFANVNRSWIKSLGGNGDKRARRTYQLTEKREELTLTLLVGDNLSNILAVVLATLLFQQWFAGYTAVLSVILLFIAILIFGDVIPKSIAKEHAEAYALGCSGTISFFRTVFYPVIMVLKGLRRLLRTLAPAGSAQRLTDTELLSMVEEAEQIGGINQDEGDLIRNVIEFDDIAVSDILTPRVDISAIAKDMPKEEIAELFKKTGYSRLPVYTDSVDYIIGIIHEKDFYSLVWNDIADIDTILKPVEFIPPATKISSLLRRLQSNKMHFAVVVDEFGGTEGIVTLEDVIEELIGDIWDEHDAVEAESFQKNPQGEYVVYCSADLDDFFGFFNLHCETDSASINGWVNENLDKIPSVNDSFTLYGLTVTVQEVENNRALVISVKGEPLPETYYTPEEE